MGKSFFILALGCLGLASTPAYTFAGYDFDKKYALETVGALRAWDNVDNVFGEYIEEAYQQYFERQSRFVYVPMKKINEVLSDAKIPYEKIISDKRVLEQAVRTAKVESLLRTKVLKEGPKYRVDIDWFHSPDMDLLGSVSFNYYHANQNEAFGEKRLYEEVKTALGELFAQLPFKGQITGIDNDSITLNLGRESGVRVGDTLVVGSLVNVRKHPLLHKLVDWRSKYIGRLVVTGLDQKICFAKMKELAPNSKLEKFQKVVEIVPAMDPLIGPVVGSEDAPEDMNEEGRFSGSESDSTIGWQPKLGWVGGGLWLGSYDRQYSSSLLNYDGGGLVFGSKLEGQVWLSRNLFLQLDIGAGFMTFSQENSATQVEVTGTTGSGTLTHFATAMGYYYHLTESFFGPKGFAKLGYHSNHYSLAKSSTYFTSATTTGGLFIGVGGDLPIDQVWGAYFAFDFGVIKSTDDDLVSTGAGSISDFTVFLGLTRRISDKVTVRGGLDVQSQSTDFTGSINVSNKVIGASAKIFYYF